MKEGEYKDNLKEGKWLEYDENGNLINEIEYVKDEQK
jgi:antitoxin component YwqK of YwqJK toxin-antitoxin module